MKPEPCYRHYSEAKSFRDCPDCGWSLNFTPEEHGKEPEPKRGEAWRRGYQQGVKEVVQHIVDMMENKKDRAGYYTGKTMCEYWISVLKETYLKDDPKMVGDRKSS